MLSDSTTFATATAYLGEAWTSVQSTLSTSDSSAAQYNMAAFRTYVRSVVGTDVDANDTLADSSRTIELSLPSVIGNSLNTIATSLNTYTQSQQAGVGVRAYYGSSVAWTDGFRGLWRSALAEELICRIGTFTRGVSIWTFAADKSIQLDTAMALKVVSLDPSSSIVVNITMTTAAGTHYLATARIPVGSTAGTLINLAGGPGKYNGVASFVVSGGTNTDQLELWLV
jgi:hypothetical protein